MNALHRMHRLALAVIVGGCTGVPDLGPLGQGIACGVGDFGRGLGTAIANSEGAVQARDLLDDANSRGAQARCGSNDCSPRTAAVGSQIELVLDAGALGVQDDPPLTVTSSDLEIISVSAPSTMVDPCTNKRIANATVTFERPGDAAIIVSGAQGEHARFTFAVHDAAALDATFSTEVKPPAMLSFVPSSLAPTLVRGTQGAGVSVRTRVRDAAGALLLTGNEAHYSIDDPSVAELYYPTGADGLGLAVFQGVVFRETGTTTFHIELAGIARSVDLQVDPAITADAGSVDSSRP